MILLHYLTTFATSTTETFSIRFRIGKIDQLWISSSITHSPPFNTYTHFVTHKRRRKYGELKQSWFIGYEVALLHSTEILFEVKTHTFIYIDYVTYMYRSLISHKTITLNMRYLRKTWISVAYLQFDTLLVNILTTRIVERVMWVQTMDNNFS